MHGAGLEPANALSDQVFHNNAKTSSIVDLNLMGLTTSLSVQKIIDGFQPINSFW